MFKRKRIAIRLDANHKIGMGHLFRMLNLADKFRENNYCCIFLIRANEIAEGLICDKGYDYKSYPEILSEDAILDSYLRETDLVDLFIFDILSTKESFYSPLKEKNIPTVSFEDLDGGLKSADLVINAIFGCWANYDNYSSINAKVLNGSRYMIINPDILKYKNKKSLDSTICKVGISMGGSDTHAVTVKIAEVFKQFNGLNVELYLFLGPHFKHFEELHTVLMEFPYSYKIYNSVKNLHKEIILMDVAICGGGNTIFEFCSIGMPVLALANEPHEEKTIEYFSKENACLNIGSVHKNIESQKIYNFFVNYKKKPDLVSTQVLNAMKLVDGDGLSRCFSECENLVNEREL